MEEQSFFLKHLEMNEKLDVIEESIAEFKQQIADLNIISVQHRVNEIKDEIESFYDALEKEVMAKRFVDENFEQIGNRLEDVILSTVETAREAEEVQKGYHLSEKDAALPTNCKQQLMSVRQRYELLSVQVKEEQSAYSSLQEELKGVKEETERLFEEQDRFADRLKSLRIDENKARATLGNLKQLLHETDRMLNKANIPGIPEEMDIRLEEAEEQLFVVVQSLKEVPLNMVVVHKNLDTAEKCIQDVHNTATEMLENVLLIERIIQYGNRYRASNPTMHQRLLEAEQAFREFRYAKALENAATAVEEAEPGAMKKIQVLAKDDN
jgi:septation ring formation regulator